MITWVEKIAFVGMTYDECGSFIDDSDVHVRVDIPDGLRSFGYGSTLEAAIEQAARRMQIDWNSVDRKITEKEWERMAHT